MKSKPRQNPASTAAIIKHILENSPTPIKAAAAAAKIQCDIEKALQEVTIESPEVEVKCNRVQFEQPNIEFLQQELENVDISTNIFYNTVN